MSDQDADPPDPSILGQRSLAGWRNEGSSVAIDSQVDPTLDEDQVPMPDNNAAELGALHIRVIALENLVISLLVTASDQQLEQARDMARYISPRSGFTHHPLTIHAAAHMVDLVERASRFRNRALS